MPDNHLRYPDDMPTECIAHVIAAMTGDDLDIQRLLKEGWLIQGWLQGLLVGDPDEPLVFGAAVGGEIPPELADLMMALRPTYSGLVDKLTAAFVKQLVAALFDRIMAWLNSQAV